MSKLLDDLVDQLSKLPTVGRRTALRLALYILREDRGEVDSLADSIRSFRHGIKFCNRCNNLSDQEICPICADPRRDRTTVCVVETVGDLLSIEHTRQYNGLYHVLGGVISPMAGIAPSDLKIDLLVDNIARGEIREVILAISATVEGETTLFYIMRRLAQFPNLKITKIARGIGVGDEIEYANELTIAHALHNRTEVTRS
ncbi:MAG: recombination mediator RecR [Tidjanibacter sp.]|nr:recombination mediator RecR [Tidjanibacter sp.]